MRAVTPKLLFVVTMTLLSMTACVPRPDAEACTAFAPVYLSEGAIEALLPFRSEREQLATHNRTWERVCTQPRS